MRVLRLGTRRSRLAMAQSGGIAEALRARGYEVDLVEIVTEGDRSTAALDEIGGTGVFASAIRNSLRDNQIDFAVHSLKDLPTAPEPGLTIAAVPVRADARDVLVARDGLTLAELPRGARVGTGSPRREAQLHTLGLGLEIVPVRGNVETRLGKVTSGQLDAVVLARAGLVRLGMSDAATEVLDPIQMLPAAGQGALALECRTGDADVLAVLALLEDADTRSCVQAERAVLRELEAGCIAPVGVLAEVAEGLEAPELSIRAFVGARDGSVELRRSLTGDPADPEGAGIRLARLLIEDGADVVREARPAPPHTPPPSPTRDLNETPEATT